LALTLAVVITAVLGLFAAETVHRIVEKYIWAGTRIGSVVQGGIVFVAVTVPWALAILRPLWSRERPRQSVVSR
jgi:hypothetical protein